MANVKLGTKAVGSIVKLKVNGTAKEFIVVHQGKPSSLYDESCNGTWLLMKDIYESRQWHSSNVNSYKASTIHSYLNSTFLGLLDANIQEAIKQVKIPYVNGTGASAVASGSNGLSVKIFLLSGYEVGWTIDNNRYTPQDGAKLDYFTAGSGGDSKRIAYMNGSATRWWLRSPFTYDAAHVWCIISGGSGNGDSASNSNGIRPALILPPDMEVDSSGNVMLPTPPATHKTLINSTAYDVKGGRCLVNGTSYDIKKGRTLIGGTGYDITFAPDVSLTWYFNETVSWTADATYEVTFTCNGQNYGGIKLTYVTKPKLRSYIMYRTIASSGPGKYITAGSMRVSPADPFEWANEAYRTITFDAPPTGDLLTWLKANAVPQ